MKAINVRREKYKSSVESEGNILRKLTSFVGI